MKKHPSTATAEVHAPGELRLAASVVTIGTFDSVHRGHRTLIGRTIRSARARRLPAVVWTLDPPPKVFFGRAESLISAEAFLAELARLNPALVRAGPDFRFGAGQAGAVPLLAERFPPRVLEPVRCAAGEVVSSTSVRGLSGTGAFAAADALQGWPRPVPRPGRAGLQVAAGGAW